MKKSSIPKHFPAILGLVLLIISLGVGIFFINQTRTFGIKASPQLSPQQVKISNTGSNSFTVTWLTTGKTTGAISVSEAVTDEQIRKDFRDQEKKVLTSSFLHFVNVDNLKPQTKYFFKVISGEKTYDNSGNPFEVTTASQKIPVDNDIASGKILTTDSRPAIGAIVFLSLANTISQAAITDSNGNWIISLATARTTDLTDFSNYDRQTQIEEILVKSEEESATATLTTGYDNPTPEIVLGQNYNFLNQMPSSSPTTPPTEANSSSQFIAPIFAPLENSDLTITSPGEGEQINNALPEFFGEGHQGQKLKIEIQSLEKIADQTVIDSQGQWSWTPNTSLSPGEHQITVSYTDNNGLLKSVSRSFVVLAAGESDLPSFTATPSGQKATLIPTINIPTATVTPVIKTPTTITPKPTATKIPTVTEALELTPTPGPEIPATGVSFPTKLFFGLGTMILITGVVLVLL